MQEWEYLFVEYHPYDLYIYHSGEEKMHKRINRSGLYVYCSQLGDDGWELVSEAIDAGRRILAFKRPKHGVHSRGAT